MYALMNRVKMSKDELQLGLFLIAHRTDVFLPDPFSACEDLICDVPGGIAKTKERLIELLKYLNLRETVERLSSWDPPRFPVNGLRLAEMGVPKGPKFARVLADLREKWKESRYTLNEEELLKFVDVKKFEKS